MQDKQDIEVQTQQWRPFEKRAYGMESPPVGRFFQIAFCECVREAARLSRVTDSKHCTPSKRTTLRFDNLFLWKADGDRKYVFVVKDDISGYAWATATAHGTYDHVGETLYHWEITFTTTSYWVSDQGPQAIDDVLSNMATIFSTTQAYGLLLPLNQLNLRTNQQRHNRSAAISTWKLKLGAQEWPAVINIVPNILNESPEERLQKSGRIQALPFASFEWYSTKNPPH